MPMLLGHSVLWWRSCVLRVTERSEVKSLLHQALQATKRE